MTDCPNERTGAQGSWAFFFGVAPVPVFTPVVFGCPNEDPDDGAPPPNADLPGVCPLPNAEVGFGVGFDSAKKSALSKLFIQV